MKKIFEVYPNVLNGVQVGRERRMCIYNHFMFFEEIFNDSGFVYRGIVLLKSSRLSCPLLDVFQDRKYTKFKQTLIEDRVDRLDH